MNVRGRLVAGPGRPEYGRQRSLETRMFFQHGLQTIGTMPVYRRFQTLARAGIIEDDKR